MTERVKPPRVGSPIIFRAQKDGPEHIVRPCSGDHRALWLSGYIILSCTKCNRTIHPIDEETPDA
ncbi:hypothetical protein [Microbacterium maritypicum]